MSFLNRMGLGFLDPTNELDKFANAIKDGDITEIVDKLSRLFGSVEDQLEDIAELFETETADSKLALAAAKRAALREVMREVRQVLRSAKADMAAHEKALGKRLMSAMRKEIAAEVARQLAPTPANPIADPSASLTLDQALGE